jgi:ABC-2 type transport system ATP-binding protein
MSETNSGANLLELRDLVKFYGSAPAVTGLNYTLKSGQIAGLLGPNGCGKTTTLKIIAGVLSGYSGTVSVGGFPVSVQSKELVSYLPEKTYLSGWMKAGYAIDYFADFYRDFDKSKAHELLGRFSLTEKQKIRTMSKGMQEKLQLILVMSRNAKLYLLDEPLSGIDPAARASILDIILEGYTEGASLLMTTHLIHDVERIFDRIAFMKEGAVILEDDVDALRGKTGKSVDELFREVFRA